MTMVRQILHVAAALLMAAALAGSGAVRAQSQTQTPAPSPLEQAQQLIAARASEQAPAAPAPAETLADVLAKLDEAIARGRRAVSLEAPAPKAPAAPNRPINGAIEPDAGPVERLPARTPDDEQELRRLIDELREILPQLREALAAMKRDASR